MTYPTKTINRQLSYFAALILFALWVIMFLTFLTSRDISITTVEQRHRPASDYSLPLRLEESNVYRQEITATHDSLGQIAVRFQTHLRINDDELIFRIKSVDSKGWDYVSTIKTDQFQPDQLFPFGFPVYPDSKNKSFVWEIESTRGEPFNSVSISESRPIIISRYQFNKAEMAQDKKLLASFILYKSLNIIQDPDSLLNLILWGSPLLVFLIAIGSKNTHIKFLLVTIIPFTILILDNLFVSTNYDLVTVLLFGFWLIIFLYYQPPKIYLAGLTLSSLTLSLIFNLLGHNKQSEKPFVWFLLFLLLFIINDVYRNSRSFKSIEKSYKSKK